MCDWHSSSTRAESTLSILAHEVLLQVRVETHRFACLANLILPQCKTDTGSTFNSFQNIERVERLLENAIRRIMVGVVSD